MRFYHFCGIFSFVSLLRNGLLKLGFPGKLLDDLFSLSKLGADDEVLKIPQASGSVAAIGAQAFFIPLYDLFLTYGGIFRLVFGPKVMADHYTSIFVALYHKAQR